MIRVLTYLTKEINLLIFRHHAQIRISADSNGYRKNTSMSGRIKD
uniref:Uncharacterized protein n=1 Tax=Meloidogyne enterolobii TaxID=390850 RepID=A0A6V7VYB0_MELEN|nr:unnamed protein product [Meloidogyne enterolobii]